MEKENISCSVSACSEKKGTNPHHDSSAEDNFYSSFEACYRGSREVIKSRLRVYLPFVLHCQELYEECSVLDLGCGRGEWLELMSENGFSVFGVDLDEGMLVECKNHRLPAEKRDALLALQELPDDSRTIISGFHIAEHLPFETLQSIVRESLRVLQPGGLLILETPNPENLIVGTTNFYIDPTHRFPLPPQLLSFLPRHYGFARTKIVRLHEQTRQEELQKTRMIDLIKGVSPDYAIIAQKETSAKRMRLFDTQFEREYGVTIDNLAELYDRSVQKPVDDALNDTHARIDAVELAAGKRIGEVRADIARLDLSLETARNEIQFRISESETLAAAYHSRIDLALESKLRDVEARTQAMEAAFQMIVNSRSWKLTAPYRAFGDFSRNRWRRFKNFLKPSAARTTRFLLEKPLLGKPIFFLLRPFPGLRARLEQLATSDEWRTDSFSEAANVPTIHPDTPQAEIPSTTSGAELCADSSQESLKTGEDLSSTPVEFESLAPHAKDLYSELKTRNERDARETE
jgi:O-antigen chain-terminating methyltransferase